MNNTIYIKNIKHNISDRFYYVNGILAMNEEFSPFIYSEEESIDRGDWFYTSDSNSYKLLFDDDFTIKHKNFKNPKKVIVLKKHFPKYFLDEIEKRVHDRTQRVQVVCEKKFTPEGMTYSQWNEVKLDDNGHATLIIAPSYKELYKRALKKVGEFTDEQLEDFINEN